MIDISVCVMRLYIFQRILMYSGEPIGVSKHKSQGSKLTTILYYTRANGKTFFLRKQNVSEKQNQKTGFASRKKILRPQ